MQQSEDEGGNEAAEILTAEELLKAQFDAIEEVNQVFEIPPATARHLLAHVNWNKERLMER